MVQLKLKCAVFVHGLSVVVWKRTWIVQKVDDSSAAQKVSKDSLFTCSQSENSTNDFLLSRNLTTTWKLLLWHGPFHNLVSDQFFRTFASMPKFIESVQSLGHSVTCGVPVSACTLPDLRSKPACPRTTSGSSARVAGQTGPQAGRRPAPRRT